MIPTLSGFIPLNLLKSTFTSNPKLKMKATIFILSVLTLTLFGCDSYSESKLFGSWRGVGVLENEIPLDLDPAEIRFQFLENGLYSFQSTFNYREAGTYKIDGDLLYTMDTINQASSEKAVRVISLSNDSLVIKMRSEGKDRLVKLLRVK